MYVKSGQNITKCMQCSNCKTIVDPDPNDWFCADDMKAVCSAKENKVIEGSLRPWEINKVEIPNWCPLMASEHK